MSADEHLSPGQFSYHMGFKDKSLSQGTLFGVDPSQHTPESRQPKGYSPERYRAVANALEVRYKNNDPRYRGNGILVYPGHAETLARAAASVARSTVPMSDITRPHPDQPATDENPDLHIGAWVPDEKRPEAGHYSKPGSTALKGQGGIALTSGGTDDQSVLHEIGHHVDRDMPKRTMSERGRAEGFAEAYATEHARTPGRVNARGPGRAGAGRKTMIEDAGPGAWYNSPDYGPKTYVEKQDFDQAYRAQHPLQPAQFDFIADTRRTLGEKTFPPHHVPGQMALLHKTGTYDPHNWGKMKDIRWDYADEQRSKDR